MKVVLFCGGQGMRLREVAHDTPKPLVRAGQHPLLLSLMRYYAHYGHRDFVLCLGHGAEAFRQYFAQGEGRAASADWRVTCVDTGLSANLGERLLAVREHLRGEAEFLVNYADVLSDLPLPELLARFRQQGSVASFLVYQPRQSFHVVSFGDDDRVRSIAPIATSGLWINAGFMACRQALFDYLRPGEELVEKPFQRLLAAGLLTAHRYEGFWATMDTPKDKEALDQLHAQGNAPWEVWRKPAPMAAVPAAAPAEAADITEVISAERVGGGPRRGLLGFLRRPSVRLA